MEVTAAPAQGILAELAPALAFLGRRLTVTDTGCIEAGPPLTGKCKYPAASKPGRSRLLRRVIYEEVVGPIPPDRIVAMTCWNRLCVRPSHMALQTWSERHLEAHARQR